MILSETSKKYIQEYIEKIVKSELEAFSKCIVKQYLNRLTVDVSEYDLLCSICGGAATLENGSKPSKISLACLMNYIDEQKVTFAHKSLRPKKSDIHERCIC